MTTARTIYQTQSSDSIRATIALEHAIWASSSDADKAFQDRAYRHEKRVKAVKRYLRERARRTAGH